jgi:Cu-Zn family superoxide dismutase
VTLRRVRHGAAGVAALALTGCAAVSLTPTGATPTAGHRNVNGPPVGPAVFTPVGDVVRVGACDPPTFTSAGGHFNPLGKQHGSLNPQGAHAGDLANLFVGTDGKGYLETSASQVTLGAGAASLLDANGSALIIHAAPDDFRTDPTGNSGARIACGVIATKK